MLKKTIIISALLLGFALTLSAQNSRALPFLELNADTRTAGMGNASMGEAKSMYLYTNPTSFLYGDQKVYTSYTFGMFPKFENESKNYHAVSAGYRFGKQAIMVGFRYLNNYPYKSVSENLDEGTKKITPSDMAVDLAIARSFGENFSAFLGGNFIRSYSKLSAYTGGVSGGVNYRNGFGSGDGVYNIGLSFHDFGGSVKFGKSGTRTSIPSSVALGGSVGLPFAEGHKVNVALTSRYFMLPSNASEFTVGAGAEYELFDMIALRAGYNYGKTMSYATFGAGFNYKFIGIDAAYQMGDSKLNNNLLRVGLNLKF